MPPATERFDQGGNRYPLQAPEPDAGAFDTQGRILCGGYLQIGCKAGAVSVVGDFQLPAHRLQGILYFLIFIGQKLLGR